MITYTDAGQSGHLVPLKVYPLSECCCWAGSYFVLSMFDRLWHKDLTEEEALTLMMKGIEEVGTLRSMPHSKTTPALTSFVGSGSCCSEKCASDCSAMRYLSIEVLEHNLQVKRRLVVAPPSYIIKVVDANGTRTVKTVQGAQ